MKEFIEAAGRVLSAFGEVILNIASAAAIALDSGYQAMDGLRALASRYDWFLTPSIDFPIIVQLAIEAMSGNATQHTIYRELRDYLREDDWARLWLIVYGMKEYSIITSERHKIVRDAATALQAHGNRGFNAVNLLVPALFAVIDGIINEFAHETGIQKWSNRKANGPVLLRKEFEKVTYAFDEPALNLIFEVLFAESYLAGKRKLNRHRILHGQWLRYGTVDNALRAFLILDFLGYAIEEYRQRHRADDLSMPITEKAQISKMYSDNVVKDIVPLARERINRIQQTRLGLSVESENQDHALAQSAPRTEPMYELCADGGDTTVVTAAALLDGLREGAPNSAARVLSLVQGEQIVLLDEGVAIRRIS